MIKKSCVWFIVSVIAAGEISRADFGDDLTPLNPAVQSGASPAPAIPSSSPAPQRLGPAETAPAPSSSGQTDAHQPVPARSEAPAAANQVPAAAPAGLLSDDVTQHNPDAPIQIAGDVVKGNRMQGKLVIEGNVKLVQDDAELLSNKATVYSDPGTTKTKRAVAIGNVRFSKKSTLKAPPLRAEAEEMEYFIPERRIRLVGQPKVWRANELIQGKEILIELDSGSVTIMEARGVVEPASSRNVPRSQSAPTGSPKNKGTQPTVTKAPQP